MDPADGWTVDTLKIHFDEVMRLQDKAVTVALTASGKAVDVAENNAEKWRQNANEWRATMTDKDRNFVTKSAIWGYVSAGAAFTVLLIAIIEFVLRFGK